MSIDPSQLTLEDIQGNILKGHGRTFTALVFFRFAQRNRAAWKTNRRLLRDAATPIRPEIAVTSAAQQDRDALAKKQADAAAQNGQPTPWKPAPFQTLGLTAGGLAACGYTAGKLGVTGRQASDQFWTGANPTMLADGGNWDGAFAMQPDGVFLLAHENEAERSAMARATTRGLQENYGVDHVEVEFGFRWQPRLEQRDKATYEHFGFADGIAKTRITTQRDSLLGQLVSKNQNYGMGLEAALVQPAAIPLEQVMFSEPGPLLGGSCLVVHKLEQNVRAFLTAEQALRERLQAAGRVPGLDPADAGALFIGRKRDGTPLVEGVGGRTNLFDFNADAGGARCPFSAHIRKMNPRQDKFAKSRHEQASRTRQNAALLVRRGVIYGDPAQVRLQWNSPAEAPDKGVGLLFMGYMTEVGPQFLKLLLTWATHEDFPQDASGLDSLLAGGNTGWNWESHPQLTGPHSPLRLDRFVRSKGAAFFVVPPLHWLKSV